MASDGKNIVGLWLEGQEYFAGTVGEGMTANDGLPVFAATKDWLA